jgi:hypothetical protein
MFLVIFFCPFTKWGIYFTTFHLASSRGHRYTIIVVEYFNKWVKAMPTFRNDGKTNALFVFKKIVARFGFPKDIVTYYGSHF